MSVLMIILLILGILILFAWGLVARYRAQLIKIRDMLDLTHLENMEVLEYINAELDRVYGFRPRGHKK